MLLEEAIARPLSPRRRSRQTARERLEFVTRPCHFASIGWGKYTPQASH